MLMMSDAEVECEQQGNDGDQMVVITSLISCSAPSSVVGYSLSKL